MSAPYWSCPIGGARCRQTVAVLTLALTFDASSVRVLAQSPKMDRTTSGSVSRLVLQLVLVEVVLVVLGVLGVLGVH